MPYATLPCAPSSSMIAPTTYSMPHSLGSATASQLHDASHPSPSTSPMQSHATDRIPYASHCSLASSSLHALHHTDAAASEPPPSIDSVLHTPGSQPTLPMPYATLPCAPSSSMIAPTTYSMPHSSGSAAASQLHDASHPSPSTSPMQSPATDRIPYASHYSPASSSRNASHHTDAAASEPPPSIDSVLHTPCLEATVSMPYATLPCAPSSSMIAPPTYSMLDSIVIA